MASLTIPPRGMPKQNEVELGELSNSSHQELSNSSHQESSNFPIDVKSAAGEACQSTSRSHSSTSVDSNSRSNSHSPSHSHSNSLSHSHSNSLSHSNTGDQEQSNLVPHLSAKSGTKIHFAVNNKPYKSDPGLQNIVQLQVPSRQPSDDTKHSRTRSSMLNRSSGFLNRRMSSQEHFQTAAVAKVMKWRSSDVAEWLTKIELHKYVPVFKLHEIDGDLLLSAVDDEMLEKEMNIEINTVRLKIVKEINRLRKSKTLSLFERAPLQRMQTARNLVPDYCMDWSFREKCRYTFVNAHGPWGKFFEVFVMIINIAACILYVVETEYDMDVQDVWKVELFFQIVFIPDYFIRFYASESRVKYFLSFYSAVDLLSIAPFFIELAIASRGDVEVKFLRVLRVLRIFRFIRYFQSQEFFFGTVSQAHMQIGKVGFTVFTVVFVWSGVMLSLEGPNTSNEITNWANAIYFTVTTLTTVGYGDISPVTTEGRWVVLFLMLSAVITIPWQASKLVGLTQEAQNKGRMCQKCGNNGHDLDAIYCKYCGYILFNDGELEFM